jgi:hypothetical protein
MPSGLESRRHYYGKTVVFVRFYYRDYVFGYGDYVPAWIGLVVFNSKDAAHHHDYHLHLQHRLQNLACQSFCARSPGQNFARFPIFMRQWKTNISTCSECLGLALRFFVVLWRICVCFLHGVQTCACSTCTYSRVRIRAYYDKHSTAFLCVSTRICVLCGGVLSSESSVMLADLGGSLVLCYLVRLQERRK